MRQVFIFTVLALALVGSASFLAGCQRAPDFSLVGVRLLMTEEEVGQAAVKPLGYVGDASFRWRWYTDGLAVGFARSSGGASQAAWVLKNEGVLQGGLSAGDPQQKAESLYGRAKELPGLPEPRIRFTNRAGHTLDIVIVDGRVNGMLLSLPAGSDPDIRATGSGSGQLPTFILSDARAIDVFPTAPGTTWTYEENYWGEGFLSIVRRTIKDVTRSGPTLAVVIEQNVDEWEITEEVYTITGDVCFSDGSFDRPRKVYPGLEWLTGYRHVVTHQEPVDTPIGPCEAYEIEFYETGGILGPEYDGLIGSQYYVDGIGLVVDDVWGKKLLEFRAGEG